MSTYNSPTKRKPTSTPHESPGDTTKPTKRAPIHKYGKRASLVSIIAPSIAFFGCQFCWAVQDGNVSPYLRELGMDRDTLNYAWLLGPISGIIFQPIIGVCSDHCKSKFGRRRPFIIIGSLLLSICLIIFCNSESFANPLPIAFITFWLLDFSTNLLEGPLRAITSDTLSDTEQLLSHSWFGIMNGFASTIAFGLGYFSGNIRLIFIVAAIIMAFTMILTSILVKEIPLIRHKHQKQFHGITVDEDESDDEHLGVTRNDRNVPQDETLSKIIIIRLRQLVIGITEMPYIVKRCWLIQFCTYFGHFANWVYLCEYFGTQIMNGNPDRSSDNHFLYKRGVEYGNLSFMFISVISVAFSFCITKLVFSFGLKKTWMGCLMIYALVMICSLFIYNVYTALFIFSFVGIPMAASFTIPWGIVASYSSRYDANRACLWTVVLNIAECGPELSVALTAGFMVELFKGKVAGVLAIAGLVNLIGVYLISTTDLADYNAVDHHHENRTHRKEQTENVYASEEVLLDSDHETSDSIEDMEIIPID